jgi:hypothetical protein
VHPFQLLRGLLTGQLAQDDHAEHLVLGDIGSAAGSNGIVAMKVMKGHNIPPNCFEKSDRVDG